jgi:hypothetical protein
MLISFSQLALLTKVYIKDPNVWLDGDRPHPKYAFKNNTSLTNSKIWPTWLHAEMAPYFGSLILLRVAVMQNRKRKLPLSAAQSKIAKNNSIHGFGDCLAISTTYCLKLRRCK